ncbi:uncharacterized protein [Palaemon carinicauda]|uniref:uncharacterized protein n=1 Tax=Palaemon carinicauda TaxID=392227 RepID=UPI0035B5DEC1
MSEYLRKPWDEQSAREIMLKFSDMAYALNNNYVFQEAVNILYGREFVIKVNSNRRMAFFCQACQKDMTSEKAVSDHCYSGAHLKNSHRDSQVAITRNFQSPRDKYSPSMLQYQLMNHIVPAVGLQMVEEYRKSLRHDDPYYKCNLCAAHGKTDAMLNHLISKKHTEKYIKSRCILKSHIITSTEREVIRRQLIDIEGLNCDLIKKIIGDDYYPYKWIAEGKAISKLRNSKAEVKHRSPSPVPGSSTHHSRSMGSSTSSHSSRTRNPSPNQDQDMLIKTIDLDSSSSPEKLEEGESSKYVEEVKFRNRSPPKFPDGKVCDKAVQKYDVEGISTRLNFVVRTMSLPDSNLITKEDIETCTEQMFAICHVFHLWERAQKNGPMKSQRLAVLEKIMGQIRYKLMPVCENMK